MNYVLPEAKSLVLDLGFLLEANAESELPEQMALCLTICKLDMHGLQPVEDMAMAIGPTEREHVRRRKSSAVQMVMPREDGHDDGDGVGDRRGSGYVDLRGGEFMVFREMVSNGWLVVVVVLIEVDVLLMTIYRLIAVQEEDLWIGYSSLMMVTVIAKLFLLFFSRHICGE